jgi:uncharacterized protein YjeT (DUF2065 family)
LAIDLITKHHECSFLIAFYCYQSVYIEYFVGIPQALTPPSLHKKFAVQSAQRCKNYFRLIGVFSIGLSFALIYAAVGL